jgi:hypothetical protein
MAQVLTAFYLATRFDITQYLSEKVKLLRIKGLLTLQQPFSGREPQAADMGWLGQASRLLKRVQSDFLSQK